MSIYEFVAFFPLYVDSPGKRQVIYCNQVPYNVLYIKLLYTFLRTGIFKIYFNFTLLVTESFCVCCIHYQIIYVKDPWDVQCVFWRWLFLIGVLVYTCEDRSLKIPYNLWRSWIVGVKSCCRRHPSPFPYMNQKSRMRSSFRLAVEIL